MPTVSPTPEIAPPSRVQRVPKEVTRLDGLLFQPSGWFVIDAANQRVPRVVITSLAQGLELVGRGGIATVVGRLADGVVVVDVDLTGHKGHGVTEGIAQWCRQQGLWHLVRPSGGAEGRTHVFVATDGRHEALAVFVDQLRDTWAASRTTIDLRTTVRPLSAPHRTGPWTPPLGNVAAARAKLSGPREQRSTAAVPGGHARAATAHGSSIVPLVPRRDRHMRGLPPEWETYLADGTRPAIAEDQPGGRSNHEALATAHLLWAGHDAATAWERITSAHRKAFAKARSKGRPWWIRHVWNPAVAADDAHVGQGSPSPRTAAAIAHARELLRSSAARLPDRLRPYYLTVGHTVLDRMRRTHALRVPVPERDLVLDTGITDRRTIRSHLARLERAGVLLIHRDTLDDAARATTSYEAEVLIPEGSGGVEQIPPPSLHTPLPSTLPTDSPAYTWLLARELTATPQDPEALALACQLSQSAVLTPGQIRTIRAALTVLSSIGLARCDEHGQWRRGPGLTSAAAREAGARLEALRAVIEAERAEYRQRRGSTWDAQRAAALKRQRAKEVAWWTGLSAGERGRRRAAWMAKFAGSTVEQQRQVKTELVERERRLGGDPVRRHQEWVAKHATEDRRLERAETFAALAPPMRAAWARAWEEHRTEHGIPRDLLPQDRIIRELEVAADSGGRDDELLIAGWDQGSGFGQVVP